MPTYTQPKTYVLGKLFRNQAIYNYSIWVIITTTNCLSSTETGLVIYVLLTYTFSLLCKLWYTDGAQDLCSLRSMGGNSIFFPFTRCYCTHLTNFSSL